MAVPGMQSERIHRTLTRGLFAYKKGVLHQVAESRKEVESEGDTEHNYFYQWSHGSAVYGLSKLVVLDSIVKDEVTHKKGSRHIAVERSNEDIKSGKLVGPHLLTRPLLKMDDLEQSDSNEVMGDNRLARIPFLMNDDICSESRYADTTHNVEAIYRHLRGYSNISEFDGGGLLLYDMLGATDPTPTTELRQPRVRGAPPTKLHIHDCYPSDGIPADHFETRYQVRRSPTPTPRAPPPLHTHHSPACQ